MDKQTLLDSARDQLFEGNIEQALDLVVDWLGKSAEYHVLRNEAVLLASLHNKTKQDQAKNTISFENAELNYGKVREGLSGILYHLEKGSLHPEGLLSAETGWRKALQTNKLLLLIGLPLLLLSIAVLIFLNKNKANDEEQAQGVGTDCKVAFLKEAAQNFLIMPYFIPAGKEIKVSGLVIERLEDFCASIESLRNSSIQSCENFKPTKLLSYEEATQKALENKASIVVWGRAEQQEATNTTVIKTRYAYFGGKDRDGKIPFTRLKQGEQQIETNKVLSIITSSGELTQDIESTLQLMLGMVANLEGDQEGTIRALHAAPALDSAANLMKYMILADNFIAINRPEEAQAALDTCLIVNRNYWLGRSNRANLRIEAGDYLGAIEDLTVALGKQPKDAAMWIDRGHAFMKSRQLYAARKDFETALEVKPEVKPQLQETIQETDKEIKRLESIVEPTKAKMKIRPLTKQQYLTAAEASNKLGDIPTTRNLVAKGLALDKDDPKLIAIQIDNLLKDNKLANAKAVLKIAVGRKIKKEEIAKHSKNVAMLIREMTLNKELQAE